MKQLRLGGWIWGIDYKYVVGGLSRPAVSMGVQSI